MANNLFEEVAKLTGLPNHLIENELARLLALKGISPQQMTMDSLREVLATFLSEVAESVDSGEFDEADQNLISQ